MYDIDEDTPDLYGCNPYGSCPICNGDTDE